MGTSEKRRSILFPFAKSTPKETKFEVVNRKKNPAQNLAANAQSTSQQSSTRSSQPSPFDPPSSSRTLPKPQPKPASSISSGPSSTKPAPLPVQSTSSKSHPLHIPNPIKHRSSSQSTQEKVTPNDLPRSNLDVNFSVPPVPDYNNTLNAPPVTIKGRSVSLTKKDAPPRRKPPTEAAANDSSSSLGGLNNYSTNSITGSALSFQSSKLDSTSVQEEEEEVKPKDLLNGPSPQKPSNLRTVSGNDIPFTEPQSQTLQPPLPPSIVITPNKSDESVPKTEPQIESQQQSNDTKEIERRTADLNIDDRTPVQPINPPAQEPLIQETQPYNDIPFQSTDSFQVSMTEPLNARSPFIDSSNNYSQADSFASASEFRDNSQSSMIYETPNDTSQANIVEQEPINEDINNPPKLDQAQTPPLQLDTQNKDVELPKFPEQVQVELGDDPDTSFEVQPLFFHKKTRSGVSDITTSSAPYLASPSKQNEPGKGHGKQLSLSDDILRDIEEFQSAIPSHVNEDPDEISPVSPLALQLGNELLPSGQQEPRRSALYEEVSYDGDDYDYDSEPELQQESEKQQLRVHNPDAEDNDADQGSLFQDSSDEDFKKNQRREEAIIQPSLSGQEEAFNPSEFDYGHVGGLDNFDSRASSVQPEVGYYGGNINDTPHKSRDELNIPAPTPGRMGLTDDDDDEDDDINDFRANGGTFERGLEPRNEFDQYTGEEFQPRNEFGDYTEEFNFNGGNNYDQQLSIPRSHSYHNISDIGSPIESHSYSSNVPSSQVKSSTTSGDEGYNYDRSSRNNESDQASSSYYGQAAQTRRFHVVNTGNYSDEDDDQSSRQFSYDQSFDDSRPDALNNDYSVIHQQVTNSPGRNRDSDDEEMLSFIAKSPVQTDFSFEPKSTSPRFANNPNNMSDIDLSKNPNPPYESPVSTTSPINAYDRRDDTVAPVQYAKVASAASRRPPPLSAAPKTTRAARSLSTSQPPPAFNYNTLQENQANDLTVPPPEAHEPEKSSYVEMLRMSSGTANSDVSARTWGVPIGIADIDHSKMSTHSSRTAYKRAQRTNKSDLKHGKIKPRLLASEVDDDDISTEVVSTMDGQSSINELEKSRTPSLHSPSQSLSNFSPNRTPSSVSGFTNSLPGSGNSAAAQAALTRSGTLLNDRIGPQLGRSGSVMSTVKPVNNMTLYIANPDIDEDD
ncbi:hypothetical protein BN7_2028 [Wickerhamomyces ciferrii]|uniref:Uncharacterized protein n=1 Tax=Wickerhamomyces ciferrii (strain ATCC 14091 / BCRC 22168 / CBS 111 / JCM 3599 / NBRC 0793 / NRRL Y-1031 F-60-10) TaxID=1206466 RepID=K0KMX9_WICCF|nr:uncharacterized protein BN7_2028 [Wickerhamomyces ciferrii]CCH42483.1 hypothetical protein BN7_2028 [Wickerhamomyces ciferrii]